MPRKWAASATERTPVEFTPPLQLLGAGWEPENDLQRAMLQQALMPTLRLFAQWLRGRGGCPCDAEDWRDHVLYATPEGLRHYLLHGLRADRPGHPISAQMASYVWYQRLTQADREALAIFAAWGTAAPPKQREAPAIEAPLLFSA